MLSGSFSSESTTDTPTHWIHCTAKPLFLSVVCAWVGVGGSFKDISKYLLPLCGFMKKKSSFSHHFFLPSISQRLAAVLSRLSTSSPIASSMYLPCIFQSESLPSLSLFCLLQPENITHSLHSQKLTIVPSHSRGQPRTNTHSVFVRPLFKESLCS